MDSHFFLGLDLGQAADYTAAILVDQKKDRQVVEEQTAAASGWMFRDLDGSSPQPRMFDGRRFIESSTASGGWYGLDEVDQMVARRPRTRTTYHYEVRGIRRYELNTPDPSIVEDVCRLTQHWEVRESIRLLIDGSGVGRPVVDMFRRRIDCSVVPVQITGGNTASRSDDGYWHVPKRDLIGAVQVVLQQGRIKLPKNDPKAALLVDELQTYQVKITEHAHDTYNARSGQHDDLVLALSLAIWDAERGGGGLGIYF